MTRLSWLSLNILLIVSLGILAQWLTQQNPEEKWKSFQEEALEPTAENQTKTGKGNRLARQPSRNRVNRDTLDTLWEKTLFRPERTEKAESETEGEENDETKEPLKNVEFELIGIGIIGTKRAAIILIKQAPAPRRRTILHRSRPLSAKNKPEKKEPESGKKTQHVYRQGATIEDTGYIVKEIASDQVTLERNGKEIVLTLERGDESSEARREAAAASKEKEKVADTKPKETPKTFVPPPPPPVPGGPDATPGATPGITTGKKVDTKKETVEERAARIVQKRKELLERLRNRNVK